MNIQQELQEQEQQYLRIKSQYDELNQRLDQVKERLTQQAGVVLWLRERVQAEDTADGE